MSSSDTEKPFFEREGWMPMSEAAISRTLDELSKMPDSNLMYLPEFYCKKSGIDFETANRGLSLREIVDKKPTTARERLQAKLAERKALALVEDGKRTSRD